MPYSDHPDSSTPRGGHGSHDHSNPRVSTWPTGQERDHAPVSGRAYGATSPLHQLVTASQLSNDGNTSRSGIPRQQERGTHSHRRQPSDPDSLGSMDALPDSERSPTGATNVGDVDNEKRDREVRRSRRARASFNQGLTIDRPQSNMPRDILIAMQMQQISNTQPDVLTGASSQATFATDELMRDLERLERKNDVGGQGQYPKN